MTPLRGALDETYCNVNKMEDSSSLGPGKTKWLPYMAKLFGVSTFCVFGQDTKISIAHIIFCSEYEKSRLKDLVKRRIRKLSFRPFPGSKCRDAF